jgi:uncharacterized radical SAM superfamily Fe-S cluster-containing enzyme
MRDWFPISMMGVFSDFADLVHGPQADWGQMCCGCHPDCGIGTGFMINKETKEKAMVPEFVNVPRLAKDTQRITDAARGKSFSNFMMALALLRNYDPFRAPQSLNLMDILKKFDKTMGATGKQYGKGLERRQDPWNFLFVAAMWFQDLFTYDFRRTEMCIIPYGTQEGEISFCAYNTGLGWRNIVEKKHMNSTTADWYKEHGRHAVYANHKPLELHSYEHNLLVDPIAARRVRQREEGPQSANDEKAMKKPSNQGAVEEKERELIQIK